MVAVVGIAGCGRPDAAVARGDAPVSSHATASDDLAGVRATVTARYAAHWRSGQGFSLAIVRATRAWFTPRLYALLEADLSGDGIGVVDHDPFVDAQESARSYAVGAPHMSHDTAYVPVDITFDSTFDDPHSHVTLAMVRGASGWQIGDFISRNSSLAAPLAAEAAKAAPVASDAGNQSATIDADTGVVKSSGPLLVAVFVTTQTDIDKDPDAGETLGDFQSDLPRVADSLSRLGVHVAVRYAQPVRAEVAGHRLRWNLPPDSSIAYVMSAPGKAPLTIWGLQDAEGVLEAAAHYFAAK